LTSSFLITRAELFANAFNALPDAVLLISPKRGKVIGANVVGDALKSAIGKKAIA
jgi:hypothetical protein